MTDKQKKQYDSWTKWDIYCAYLTENNTRKKLNKELNESKLQLELLKYNLKQLLIN